MDLGELPAYRMVIQGQYDERFRDAGDEPLRRFHDRSRPYVDRVVAALNLPDEGSFLDIGCGTGLASLAVARARPNFRVTGIDLSDTALELARRLAKEQGAERVNYQAGEAEAPPTGPWDRATVLSVFNLLSDKRGALEAWRRVLHPRGRLVLTDAFTTGASTRGVGPLSEPAFLRLLNQTGWRMAHREDITRLVTRLNAEGGWFWSEYLRPGYRYLLVAIEPVPGFRGPGTAPGSTS
ncbi:MAG TPA: methyltransferase domain-containing protein [Candidatus Thermoplasmatota archaeon]|nr:methyltransferase domain-containing protein [Candidatus Thermoplasmatota archaeon]